MCLLPEEDLNETIAKTNSVLKHHSFSTLYLFLSKGFLLEFQAPRFEATGQSGWVDNPSYLQLCFYQLLSLLRSIEYFSTYG